MLLWASAQYSFRDWTPPSLTSLGGQPQAWHNLEGADFGFSCVKNMQTGLFGALGTCIIHETSPCHVCFGSYKVPDWVTNFMILLKVWHCLCVVLTQTPAHCVLNLHCCCCQQTSFRCASSNLPPFPPIVCCVKKILMTLMATLAWKVMKLRPLYHHHHWLWIITLQMCQKTTRHSWERMPMCPWGRTWNHLCHQVWS